MDGPHLPAGLPGEHQGQEVGHLTPDLVHLHAHSHPVTQQVPAKHLRAFGGIAPKSTERISDGHSCCGENERLVGPGMNGGMLDGKASQEGTVSQVLKDK